MHNPNDMRERFLRDHARINVLAADLITLLDPSRPPDIAKLSSARWAFASNLMQHLQIKERHIYAKLESDNRPQVRSFSQKSKADLVRRFEEYTRHMDAWPTSTAMTAWPTYCPRAIVVVRNLTERLRYEETELFDALVRFDIDITFPSSVTSNWVRKAFDVKARVEDQ